MGYEKFQVAFLGQKSPFPPLNCDGLAITNEKDKY